MKFVYWGLGTLFGLVLIVFGLQIVASERVEVVELTTTDLEGEEVITHLWIVDDEGYQYLRVGADGSGWYSRIQENGEIRLTRGGRTSSYTITPREEKSDQVNQLMQEKYTWGDTLIGYLAGSREGSIPLELHPVD